MISQWWVIGLILGPYILDFFVKLFSQFLIRMEKKEIDHGENLSRMRSIHNAYKRLLSDPGAYMPGMSPEE